MESTIVLKVKYGETLRRANVHVNESGQLDLDMDGLRKKILGLFNFALDANVALTYIDEDGDVVTLADEEDLHDVMRQSLNPLRITVKLNAEKGGRSYTRSSGSSTPMISPRNQNTLPNLNGSVSEILKSVPEPFCEALFGSPRNQNTLPNMNSSVSEFLKSVPEPFREGVSKLSLNLATRASSSVPGLAELVDSLSKMGHTYINLLSETQAGTESSSQSDASGSAMGASVNKEREVSKDEGAASEVMPNANEGPTNKINQKVNLLGSRGIEASVIPTSDSLKFNTGLPGDSSLAGFVPTTLAPVTSFDVVCDSEEYEKLGECRLAKAGDFGWKSIASNFPSTETKEVRKSNEPGKPASSSESASTADSIGHSPMDFNNINLGGIASTIFPRAGLIGECPFTGMPVASESDGPSLCNGSRVPPFKRSYNHSEGMGGTFHRGVRCDGCGAYPITGPRFKSKVKEDYDLCSICFLEMGNEADYIKMDRPGPYRCPYSSKGLYDPMQYLRMRSPSAPQVLRGSRIKPSRPKLDSRFIMDVNVLDGTIMAPSTPFTKIWRMRNNGTLVWPQGTQLVWIGGDKLSTAISVKLEISSYGLAVDDALDVAVDFFTPELPGRYISYWRMTSPYGQKFGQRVWVLIQVDASPKDSPNCFGGLNLNLPPDSSGLTGREMVNLNVDPSVEDSLCEPNSSNTAADSLKPFAYRHPIDQELNFPINDTLLVGGGVSNPLTPEAPTSISYPIIDLSELPTPLPLHLSLPPTDPQALAPGANENTDVEQTLLRELEEMGFKEVDLNKEILRKNEYDLEQSVDDLCGVAMCDPSLEDKWDPILGELQEMGFSDKEMNKRLLKKNKGSIKRVVMDLIAGENV